MFENEEKLVGGNVATFVVRVGQTVRKPMTEATPSIQALLQHLENVGFKGAPHALGIDEHGRQVLEFVPGVMWDTTKPAELEKLGSVGALIRKFHDAAATFVPPEAAHWDRLAVPDGTEIICHNDLAPWNLICGAERFTFIDWDNAAPGTRLWDLAWAAISFPPVVPGCDLPNAARSIRAFCDGYGLLTSEYALLVEAAHTGQQPWARLFAENGDHYWGPVSDYIQSSASALVNLLQHG
jgi:Ser/Thr protein kinase RdoA (MazF antagonist)